MPNIVDILFYHGILDIDLMVHLQYLLGFFVFLGAFCVVALDLAAGNGVSSFGGIRRSSMLIEIFKN